MMVDYFLVLFMNLDSFHELNVILLLSALVVKPCFMAKFAFRAFSQIALKFRIRS